MGAIKKVVAGILSGILAIIFVAACVAGVMFFGTIITIGGILLTVVAVVAIVAYGVYELFNGKH